MTNKITHTQGPWEILPEECDKPYIRIRGSVLGRRYKIANVLTPTYEGVRPEEAEETRCNARLIAAAPDLLEALKGLYEETADYLKRNNLDGINNQHMRLARIALRKALPDYET